MSKVYYESKNLNRIPEDVMEDMLGRTCQCGKQKDDLEREYQNVKNQNEDLRKRIAQLKGEIGKLEQEIRNQNNDGSSLMQMIQNVMSGNVAEIQLTIRTGNCFTE